MDDLIESKGSDRGRERGAVEDTEVLLGLERDGCNVVLGKRIGGGHNLARTERRGTIVDTNRRVADQGTSNVRQR